MPVTVVVDSSLETVLLRGEGILFDRDLIRAAKTRNNHPSYRPSYRMLADYSHADLGHVTPRGMKEVAKLNTFSPEARCAVVVPTPLAQQLGATLRDQHAKEERVLYHLFTDRNAALDFLNRGLPPEKAIR